MGHLVGFGRIVRQADTLHIAVGGQAVKARVHFPNTCGTRVRLNRDDLVNWQEQRYKFSVIADIGSDVEVGSARKKCGNCSKFFVLKVASKMHLVDEVARVLDKEQGLAGLVAHPAYRVPEKPLVVAFPSHCMTALNAGWRRE